MNLRSTAFLFGLSLGMLWLFGLLVASKRTTFDETLIMPTFPPDVEVALDSITIKRKEDKAKKKPALDIEMVKTATGWYLSGKNKIRLDDNQVGKVISDVKTAAKIDESDASPDPVINGLTDPQIVVTIKGKVGKDKDEPKTWQIEVGNESADETRDFVSSSDRPGHVLVVAKTSLGSLNFKDESFFRPTQLFDFNVLSVKDLKLKDAQAELEIKKSDDTWRIAKPPMGPADYEGPLPPKELVAVPKKETPATGGVKALIEKIKNLQVAERDSDFVSPTADVNTPEYGLEPGKESLRIQVISGDGKKEEALLVGSKVQDKDLRFAHMENDPGVFMIGDKQLEPFREYLKKPGELRSTSILLVDVKKVDKIKIKLGKEEIVLTHPEEKQSWLVQMGDGKPAPANEETVMGIFEALESKHKIDKFYDVEGDAAKKLDAELVLDGSLGEITLSTETQPKKTKDEKKEEKKDEKKETKTVTLILGKADKDIVPVKRIQQDGTISRFALPKASGEKIIPADPKLAFLGTALPRTPYEEVDSLILERGKEKLEFIRGTGVQAGRWLLKQTGSESVLADNGKVNAAVRDLADMHARKWLRKIDEKKADLASLGLEPPVVKAAFVLRKPTPAAATSLVGFLGSSLGSMPLESAVSWLVTRAQAKTETLAIRFGKETEEEKDKPGSFTLHGGSDMLFLVAPEFVERLKTEDFRDRSMLLAMQQILDAGALSAGPANLLVRGPIVTRMIHSFDPTKIKDLRVDVHQYDLRKFHFVRQEAEKPKEKEKDKADKDKAPEKEKAEKDKAGKPAPPPSVKGQTWQNSPDSVVFSLDSKKVNELVEEFAKLQADRWVAVTEVVNPDFKLDPKEAILKIDATLVSGQVVTLTVGAKFQQHGYFAQSSLWPGVVFLLSPRWVESYLGGAADFGKSRIARD